ncbi:hypothetical protein J0S82_002728 [Galemys pyrenaicus]|uniref:Uncharacterized protein n=1 Tax=Galemys pyrenaicus TaxID=202257 RepID=A0A8J5ZM67_GALPY|nr:hypothetical protein J0S82_002728 [Galemys pyrenaicus]
MEQCEEEETRTTPGPTQAHPPLHPVSSAYIQLLSAPKEIKPSCSPKPERKPRKAPAKKGKADAGEDGITLQKLETPNRPGPQS